MWTVIQKQADLEVGWYEFEKVFFEQAVFEGKSIPRISVKGQKFFMQVMNYGIKTFMIFQFLIVYQTNF